VPPGSGLISLGERREPCPVAAHPLRGAEGAMKSAGFWRDIGLQFRESQAEGRDLHAVEVDDGTWLVGGGPHDTVQRKSLQNRFRDLAVRAATGAGLVGGAGALDAWLNRLKQGPHFVPVDVVSEPIPPGAKLADGGWIDELFMASVEVCSTLETDAFVADATSQRLTVGDRITKLREACGWTVEDLAGAVELAKSSVIDHTKNRSMPRPDTLTAYAGAFSTRLGREVTVEELRGGN